MIFNEIYSKYYRTVSRILSESLKGELSDNQLYHIIEENAFSDSVLEIPEGLKKKWMLIKDGKSVVKSVPDVPLTTLERRWLKTILQDKKARLFFDEIPDMEDVEPLYPNDFFVKYDQYTDGDPYDDETYIQHFRTALKAIQQKKKISVEFTGKRGLQKWCCTPVRMEYSGKDDKFRLIAFRGRHNLTIKMNTVVSVTLLDYDADNSEPPEFKKDTVTVMITDRRNTLERFMIDFSHFEKEARQTDDGRYEVKVTYYHDDETEILIRIMAYGPNAEVTEPSEFRDKIKERLIKQMKAAEM